MMDHAWTVTALDVWNGSMARLEAAASVNPHTKKTQENIQAMHFDIEKIERIIAAKFSVVKREERPMISLRWKIRGSDGAEITLDLDPIVSGLWVCWKTKGGPISLKWEDYIENIEYHPDHIVFQAEPIYPNAGKGYDSYKRFSFLISPGYFRAVFPYPHMIGRQSRIEIPVWPVEPRVN